jgi:pimeloyl-ACP methyl ester carboxylesterase
MEAATSNKPPSGGRTYLVTAHRLYLRCVGSGSPAVILFNGLGARTPSWAWVQGDVARKTRVCVFDRAGQGWSGKGVGRQDAHQLSADVQGLCGCQGSRPIRPRRSLGWGNLRTRLRDGLSEGRGWGRVDRLVHPVPV